ncbi:PfkB family carbohydrate kinase [Frigidibacter sp. ROC022]|uniref:PfkB family carbohydrate kinase n=1 Tax=Frigidibacter sp. ROC022 TaxID=2971796 RepID=UPI00215A6FE7|nr:PfkB family carbohydrate kinase [Frigidibacter sp. ROC022]MCR8723493.1 PfkB family carbohydrate kinase [Frigidibacter sp. ROC022]
MGRLIQMTGPVVDLVYYVRALPERGQEAEVTGFDMTSGGGFNAMAAARAAGQSVVLGGSLGTGPMADRVALDLDALGISLARARLTDVDQGCCTVLLEPDGERTFISYPGAEGHATAEALSGVSLDGVTQVLMSGYSLHYTHARTALAEWVAALPRGITFAFDPAPVVARLDKALLAKVMDRADWVSVNAEEAAVLTGDAEPERAARALARGRAGAILRRGRDGELLAQGSDIVTIPGHPVDAIDTNGAGDCHVGSFLAELDRHGDALRAVRYANVAAALSTLRRGPATAPDRATVEAILNEQQQGAAIAASPTNMET